MNLQKLPVEWYLAELRQVAERIIVGLAISVTDFYATEGVPIIRNTNISGGKLDESDIYFITREFAEENSSKCLKACDVITVRTGPNVGASCVVPEKYNNAHTFTTLITTPNHELLDSYFLAYYLNSPVSSSEIERLTTSGGRGNLNTNDLRNLRIPIPPLSEQRKITKILSTWDEAIAKTEQLIAMLQQRKRGLMHRLLTGEVRFPGFDKEWKEYHIGKVAKLTAGGTPSTRVPEYWGGDIRWMNSGEIHLKRIRDVENRITQMGLENSSAKLIPVNSVLIALAGQGKTRGTVAINKIELSTNQSVAAIMPNGKVLNYEYLFYNLDARYEEMRRLSTGDGGRGGLNLKLLSSIKVIAPSLPEQARVSDILRECDNEIELQQRKLSALRQQKKGLMQRLLTGQVRVKVK